MNPLRSIFLLLLTSVLALSMSVLAAADPPGRVARLALSDGSVFLLDQETHDWLDASVNWPVTTGDVLHAGHDGRAELRIGSGAIRMASDSEIEVRQLDDEQIRIWLEYGSVAIRVRSHDPVDWITIDTRDGRILATEPGQYRVDYANATTTVTAHRGALGFFADDSQTTVAAGQRVEIRHSGRTTYRHTSIVRDAFADWYLAHDERDDALGQPRYVSAEMTGAEDLVRHGSWSHYADFGPVWSPHHVPLGWVPYRYGRWVWVRPWGWTWLDDAPWGFAPFHYGRWAMIHGRWAWIPGAYTVRPVYAPALVAWVGSSGWSIGFSFGTAPAVGWFPLGPHEVYVPVYRTSPIYVHRLNIVHVTSVTHITRATQHPRREWHAYRNHREAATVVPVATLKQRRAVHRDAVRDPHRWIRDTSVAQAAPAYVRADSDPERRARTLRLEGERERRSGDDQVRRATNRSATVLREPAARPAPATGTRHTVRTLRPPVPNHNDRGAPSAREDQAGVQARQEQRTRAPASGLESSVRTTRQRTAPQVRSEQGPPPQAVRGEAVQRQQRTAPQVQSEQGPPSQPVRGEALQRQQRTTPQARPVQSPPSHAVRGEAVQRQQRTAPQVRPEQGLPSQAVRGEALQRQQRTTPQARPVQSPPPQAVRGEAVQRQHPSAPQAQPAQSRRLQGARSEIVQPRQRAQPSASPLSSERSPRTGRAIAQDVPPRVDGRRVGHAGSRQESALPTEESAFPGRGQREDSNAAVPRSGYRESPDVARGGGARWSGEERGRSARRY